MGSMKITLTSDVTGLFDEIGEHLRYESRFSLPEKLQKAVDRFCSYHVEHASTLFVDQEYWRARINPVGKEDAYKLTEVGAPPKGIASSGRINPPGISYLYGASDKETALSEVRPWKGAIITVANFNLKEELKVADFTQSISLPILGQDHIGDFNEKLVTDLISRIIQAKYFSAPAHAHDDYAYLASQYIAEQLKRSGMQGIKYPSVLSDTGDNICIFMPEKANFVNANIVKVKGVSYTFE